MPLMVFHQTPLDKAIPPAVGQALEAGAEMGIFADQIAGSRPLRRQRMNDRLCDLLGGNPLDAA